MENLSIIITAGGVGNRMGSKTPKQFLELNGEPILAITIRRMNLMVPTSQIIVALPEESIPYWKNYCSKSKFSVIHEVVAGGKERFYSVKNALGLVKAEAVFVHDGVRPLFSKSTIDALMSALEMNDATIPVMSIYESLREKDDLGSHPVDRNQFFTVQTPQAFKTKYLKEAYLADYTGSFTDDASVVEAKGGRVSMIEGNPENIKITKPEDLKMAEFLLKHIDDSQA
jgi:2-C-methyl-D-erythritol 4-phosphate cytidylyltransferase